MRLLIENVRQRIRNAGLTEQILLNEAKALEVGMMDICESEKLRKLMFMLQFEVVLRLQELWQNRLDGCPNAPLLRYVGAEKRGATWENIFDIVSGALEPPVEERAFHDWLLVEEPEGPSDHLKVPPEIYFDDLSLSGLFFPLTKYTKPKWEEQHPIVKEKVFIANVREIRLATSDTDVSRPRSQAVIQISFTGKTFQKGKLYRISPRHVDFNLSRVLQNLVMMDFQGCLTNEQVPFMKLIHDPQEFAESESFCDKPAEIKREQEIARGLNELENLGNVHAKALKLKDSQHRAARRMLFKRLSVVWGPPGTGKTYTLALSTLRMIEVLGSTAIKQCPIILVTAMTHAAIEAIVGKLNSLIGHYRALKERDTSWLDMISLERVLSGTTHQAPKVKKVYIYAGTTYQLYKFCEKSRLTANVIIIDEAGQLALGTAALVIRWLSHNGKLVLAGDHQQLAPILATVYPEPPEERPLFGSVLDLLMDRKRGGLKIARTMSDPNSRSQDDERDGVVVQLLENFRLNDDLGAFVERIYAKKFQVQNSLKTEIGESLQLWLDTEEADDPIMEDTRLFLLDLAKAMLPKGRPLKLLPPRADTGNRLASLALIRVKASGSSMLPYESHVKAEARLAAALVHWLRESFGSEETIFVACPHRIQRSAVRQAILAPGEDWGSDEIEAASPEGDVDAMAAALEALHVSDRGLRIDTVERLQSSEASFVIFLMAHTHGPSLSNHLEFLLSRRRLNVGISRAKALCIMVSSRGVLQPSLDVLAKEESRLGLEFLRGYEDSAWTGDIDLRV